MKWLLNGYVSLIKEAFGVKNDGAFLVLPANLGILVLACGMIGLTRNALHVLLITPIFYSFAPDILWTMFFWPIHLFLFPSAVLHYILRISGYSRINVESLFSLAFYLQLLHLLVPFIDWIGFAFGLPWMYELGMPAMTTDLYINFLVMTPGIIFVWWATGYMVIRFFRQFYKINWPTTLTSSIIAFLIVLIPIYFIWPSFNTLFNHVFGILVWDSQDPRLNVPRQIQWGYGTYMAVTSAIGLAYYVRIQNTKQERK